MNHLSSDRSLAKVSNPSAKATRVLQTPQGTVEILNVPDVRQDTDYTCGPSSLQAVLGYYGDEQFESDLAELCHSDPQEGTPPENIAKAARQLGYQAEVRQNLTLEDLEKSVKSGVPVIIDAQAWSDECDQNKPWKDRWNDGHYMVVIGMDQKNIYLEDPSIFHSKGCIERGQFLDRWHDIDNGVVTNHLGIFIRADQPKVFPDVIPVD